ncbi:MAG: bifunctional pyr operon transcriptional regulator/uracil phosphoribosyltransferase PyrR [Saprospiraceae bacterium]|nr:bifunctional pyr operon transcriptional regulator/uracil phosphoribosyltransferase PyrR [Saprospiraceae bacterium]MCB9322921.1 bifunctional pyr operon transcriptional regulator/uracil phosphoribosyltransferase PyrR [Lewinellaceae bacterium]
MEGRIILGGERFLITIDRLCQQLIEDHADFSDVCLVGIQARGVLLADRIYERLTTVHGITPFPYGKLDISFYRDDFRRRDKPLRVNANEMDFLVENKRVILVDDVLFSGRTVQAALTALNHYGRPRAVELLVLVDRRFHREIPVSPDYSGLTIDALENEYVKVNWEHLNGQDEILLFPPAKAGETPLY